MEKFNPEREFEKIILEEDERSRVRQTERQTERHEGAIKLQLFLQNLESEGYGVERKGKVIVIAKT